MRNIDWPTLGLLSVIFALCVALGIQSDEIDRLRGEVVTASINAAYDALEHCD